MKALLLASASLFALPVAASPFTLADINQSQGILSNLDVVVAGDYVRTGSETEGRVAIGGNLTGSGNWNAGFNQNYGNVAFNGATYGELTVYGNVSGGTVNIFHGDASIGGAQSAYVEFGRNGGLNLVGQNSGTIDQPNFVRTAAASAGNVSNAGGSTTTSLPGTTVFPNPSFAAAFGNPLSDLTSKLGQIVGGLGNVQAIPANSNNFSSTATAATGGGFTNAKQYGFYTTTTAALASAQNFQGISAGNLDAVFIIVSGAGSLTLPVVQNNATKVVWVLPSATSVVTSGKFDGTILAPNAAFSNAGGTPDALVYAATVAQSNNEFHSSNLFTGDISGLSAYVDAAPAAPVSEPANAAILGAALVAMGRLRRKTG